MWSCNINECFVIWMWQVVVAVFIGRKSNEKTMRKSLRKIFWTYIRSPLEGFNRFYFRSQSSEGIFNLFDVLLTTAVFKLKKNHMA